ncbi:MAG: MBL fold metallo-hydrolase [Xanthomonadales bacterium]|nr:MBL fold metallo-hydrolase [Xanthomonadales bacterium]
MGHGSGSDGGSGEIIEKSDHGKHFYSFYCELGRDYLALTEVAPRGARDEPDPPPRRPRLLRPRHEHGKVFNEGTEFRRDGSQFDQLFADGDTWQLGSLSVRVLHTPGHTPACTTHVIGDAAFVGDTLFMPDAGSARADFPGGDARTLFRSMRRILSLPPETRLFLCHDYGPGGREIRWETTVAEQRAHNIHVRDGIAEDDFVALRTARDATLGMPKLILPSLQVNMRAGQLPPADADGRQFLKLPVNAL